MSQESEGERELPADTRLPPVDGELDRALALVRFLRAHCPWDASRTPLNLLPHLIEESHEVADAVRTRDADALEGELGDLLLNLAFQVVLGEEEGRFDAASVAERLEEKMVRRHPHLFGRGEKEDWERMKARERREAREAGADGRPSRSGDAEGGHARPSGALDGLPGGLDPLLRAHRIQERVSGVGFDWDDPGGALEKVAEELEEVREALDRLEASPDVPTRDRSSRELREELGDLLFSVVNLARLVGSHASTLLSGANRKFSDRFRRLETLARERGVDVEEASLDVLDALWDELKTEE